MQVRKLRSVNGPAGLQSIIVIPGGPGLKASDLEKNDYLNFI
jgi:hypothetical protein